MVGVVVEGQKIGGVRGKWFTWGRNHVWINDIKYFQRELSKTKNK